MRLETSKCVKVFLRTLRPWYRPPATVGQLTALSRFPTFNCILAIKSARKEKEKREKEERERTRKGVVRLGVRLLPEKKTLRGIDTPGISRRYYQASTRWSS